MIKHDEILARVKCDIEAADNFYENEIKPKVDDWKMLAGGDEEYYKKYFPEIKGKFVSRDIANTVEYIIPDLMKLFNGAKDPIVVRGRTMEDMEKADAMQSLCNYQLSQLNSGFLLNYNWFKEALYYGIGVIKARWERKMRTDEYETIIAGDQYSTLIDSGVKIIKEEFAGDLDPETGYALRKVRYEQESVEKNEPVFENLKIEEFRYDPEARNIKDAAFCAHIKDVSADFLRNQEKLGVYTDVEKAIDAYKDYSSSETYSGYDKGARKKVQIKEYYGKIDVDDSGKLQDVVVTLCGDTILSVQENTYGRYPFFTIAGIMEPHVVQGRSISALLEQIQNLKTVMVRELIVNAARNNDRRTIVDSSKLDDPAQLVNGDKYISVRENPANVFQYEPFEPMSPNIMTILEYAERERETNSGVSEIKQGVIPSKMATTATFANLLYEAANARVQIIARIFAETGVKDMYEWLVDANQKFIDQKQVLRLTNKYLEIDPSSLQNAFFDLDISSGLGTGASDIRKQSLEVLLQLSMNTLMPAGISNPDKLRNITEAIIEELGFKDTGRFILTKEEQEQEKLKQQAEQQNSIQAMVQHTVAQAMQEIGGGTIRQFPLSSPPPAQ